MEETSKALAQILEIPQKTECSVRMVVIIDTNCEFSFKQLAIKFKAFPLIPSLFSVWSLCKITKHSFNRTFSLRDLSISETNKFTELIFEWFSLHQNCRESIIPRLFINLYIWLKLFGKKLWAEKEFGLQFLKLSCSPFLQMGITFFCFKNSQKNSFMR